MHPQTVLEGGINAEAHTFLQSSPKTTHTLPQEVPQQQLRAELKRSQREVKDRTNNQLTDLGDVSV